MQSKRTRANRRAAAGTLLALLLTACASTPPAPVEDIALDGETPRPSAPVRHANAGHDIATHKVVAGDTLYSIAFKNGMDYRELARINRIESPFRIYVGQDLRLAEPPPAEGIAVSAVPAPSGAATVTPLPESPLRKTAAATPAPPNTPGRSARRAQRAAAEQRTRDHDRATAGQARPRIGGRDGHGTAADNSAGAGRTAGRRDTAAAGSGRRAAQGRRARSGCECHGAGRLQSRPRRPCPAAA
ncbi:LysM peptidoglycan-binding domain-containing protein [Tahibacter sp. UC22_41]|uniref:LysM peptidoglycan-binding domain-containing protein n=1 Tax=Tahibacter sp. UC22_41 TaxID=3350178 RepID=UPI0036DA24D0